MGRRLTATTASLLAAVATAAAPAPAAASRPATPDEIAAIVAGGAEPDGGMACWIVSVSTASPKGSHWARLSGNGAAGCPPDNEFAVATTTITEDGTWATTYSGLVGTDDRKTCSQQEVPELVGRDLRICSPPLPASRTVITCWNPKRWTRRPVKKPQNCDLPGSSNANAVILRGLRWHNWGRSSATATGWSQAVHGRPSPTGRLVFDRRRVRVTARKVIDASGRRWYSELRVTTRGRSRTVKVPHPFAGAPDDYYQQ